MIGFELKINGETITGAVEEGVFSVILTSVVEKGINSINLDFTGLDLGDTKVHKMIDWHKSHLKNGDEISIKIIDVSEISAPQKIREQPVESGGRAVCSIGEPKESE